MSLISRIRKIRISELTMDESHIIVRTDFSSFIISGVLCKISPHEVKHHKHCNQWRESLKENR